MGNSPVVRISALFVRLFSDLLQKYAGWSCDFSINPFTFTLLAILLTLLSGPELCLSQSYTEQPFPSKLQNLTTAEIFLGRDNSLHILAFSDSLLSNYFDTELYRRTFYVLKNETSSSYSEVEILDSTTSDVSMYEGGYDEGYSACLVVDSSDDAVVAWSKGGYYTSDIAYPRKFTAPVVSYAAVDSGDFRTIFHFRPGTNPSLAIGLDGARHLVWERPIPFWPQQVPGVWAWDTNYYFCKSEICYASIRSNMITDSVQNLGKGYRPQIQADKAGGVHVFWLQADSSNSCFYRLICTKGTDSHFEPQKILYDSVRAKSLGYQFYETPTFQSFIDDSGCGYAGWFDNSTYNDGRLYFVTVRSEGTVKIDTLGHQKMWSTTVNFYVEHNGTKHAVWMTYDSSSTWTLRYSYGSFKESVFAHRRVFYSTAGFPDTPQFIVDSRDSVACIFTDSPLGIGFLRNLKNGPDSVIHVSPGSTVVSGMRDQWGNSGMRNAAVVDNMDQTWVAAFRNGLNLVKFEPKLTRVETNVSKKPSEYALLQNYPNPFNPSTTIRFTIAARSRVRLAIFNLIGQRIAELADEEMNAGNYERVWNAKVTTGVYFCRLEAVSTTDPNERFVDVKKMTLLK